MFVLCIKCTMSLMPDEIRLVIPSEGFFFQIGSNQCIINIKEYGLIKDDK